MRTIGLDLAVQTAHKAVVPDEHGHCCTPILTVHTLPNELDQLLGRAREGAPSTEVQLVMEPTGMAWFPIAVYYTRQAVPMYLVNSQEVADLRRSYQRHAKVIGSMRGCWLGSRWSTQISSTAWCCPPPQLLPVSATASSWITSPPRSPPSRTGCRRSIALCGPDWKSRFSPIRLRLRPASSASTGTIRSRSCRGVEAIRQQWMASTVDADEEDAWVEPLLTLAQQLLTLYGTDGQFLDFEQLQADVQRDQAWLIWLDQQHHTLRLRTVRPLYRAMHPSRNLETLKGVGQDSAAIYASFIGDPHRFRSTRLFRG